MDFPVSLERQLADLHLDYQRKVEKLRDQIDERDAPARQAYEAAQAADPNIYAKSWYDLSESERYGWRSRHGDKR